MVSPINTYKYLTAINDAPSTSSSTNLLPDELLLRIFTFLTFSDLMKIHCLNHKLYKLTLEPELWRPYCHFGDYWAKRMPILALKKVAATYHVVDLDQIVPTLQKLSANNPTNNSLTINFKYPFANDTQIKVFIENRHSVTTSKKEYIILDRRAEAQDWKDNQPSDPTSIRLFIGCNRSVKVAIKLREERMEDLARAIDAFFTQEFASDPLAQVQLSLNHEFLSYREKLSRIVKPLLKDPRFLFVMGSPIVALVLSVALPLTTENSHH